MPKIRKLDLIEIFSLPVILYVVLVLIRLKDLQPSMEGELGDFLTALNFLFGAFVAYFIFVCSILQNKQALSINSWWWWLMCILLTLLAFDELFMIHEMVGHQLGIKDTLIFLGYGGVLGILLLFNLKESLMKNTFGFLLLFAVFSVVSQVSDYLYNEGVIAIMGREISYEQFLESFGALSLSCAIVTIAIRDLVNAGMCLNDEKNTSHLDT